MSASNSITLFIRIADSLSVETKLTEMELPESKVLESLNAVSTAKRLANMEVHDSDFGKREEIHRIKSAKRKADVGGS